MDERGSADSRFCNANEIKQLFYHDKCDKYDYLVAVGCGAIAGLVDIFFLGSPADSKLERWTDAQVDQAVMAFARKLGWKPNAQNAQNVKSAIGFLERGFAVNYDQRHSGDVNNLFRMSTKNHHLKSLAHSPDPIGLFFSILNQFTSTSSFFSNGKLITIETESFDVQENFRDWPLLQGHNFAAKLFCGFLNWLFHIMSDVAGSSGAIGRGSGVALPFYELFQLCDFGNLQVGQYRNTIATIATKVFEEGYDARFGLTMSIPVILCDLSIKLLWAIKHYFYNKRPLSECIPNKWHDDLRIMLIFGDGTLCLMDGADAAIRSGGNWVNFFLRLNIIAWFRLVSLVLREICIRTGISFPVQKQLETNAKVNDALKLYLSELEQIDFEAFRKETEHYNRMITQIERVDNENELNILLKLECKLQGISLPYEGEFNDFMQDRNGKLVFQ